MSALPSVLTTQKRFVPLTVSRDGVVDIADRARDALFEFVTEAPSWNKRALVRWLTGPYEAAVIASGPVLPSQPRQPNLTEEQTRAIIKDAHDKISATMGDLSWARSIDIGAWALGEELVVRIKDARGGFGFAPLHRPGLALYSRLLGLFATDYLVRPLDYVWVG